MNFEKKKKGGLKKCPMHKSGSTFLLVEDEIYECQKCHGFKTIEKSLGESKEVKVWRNRMGKDVFEFDNHSALII